MADGQDIDTILRKLASLRSTSSGQASNELHIDILRQGVLAWNSWRDEHWEVRPELRDANLSGMDLTKANLHFADFYHADLSSVTFRHAFLDQAEFTFANLSGVDLTQANLYSTDFFKADLSDADLSDARLIEANISCAKLIRANLSWTKLMHTNFTEADLTGANLRGADLSNADFSDANLRQADLSDANLSHADFSDADLTGARLSNANLMGASLVNTNLTNAVLNDCKIFGVSAWQLELSGAEQKNLIITDVGEPTITVDDLEVAQFIYLLLNNQKIRRVIDTITSKVVLILGRFKPERKAVLEAIRRELRKRDYLPILFDFEKPAGQDFTETITLLARMARFIVADLTEPSSIPQELQAIVPDVAVPIQPLLDGTQPYSMFKDYRKYPWVLDLHRYNGLEDLLASLDEKVIAPAEAEAQIRLQAGPKDGSACSRSCRCPGGRAPQ